VRQVSDIPEGDGRGRHPRFVAENLARNLAQVATIETVARSGEVLGGAKSQGVGRPAAAPRSSPSGRVADVIETIRALTEGSAGSTAF
jgi:hypothetical protein